MSHEHSILVVEDDTDLRGALAGLLEDQGFGTLRAKDGVEALKKIREVRRPCLILLDLMMPRMNGWEFLELHRSDRSLSSIPLVLVTAFRDTEPAQAKAMITKPIDVPKMIETLERLLRDEEKAGHRGSATEGRASGGARRRQSH